jgi:hypothetical protein
MVCDFHNRETTGCIAMSMSDRDIQSVRADVKAGDSITGGKYAKTGRV